MLLSVIIVSYNVKYYVSQCLDSLLKSHVEGEIEIFVVDNASTDGTPLFLSQLFPTQTYPQIHYLFNKRNVGFGRANNQALEKASGTYILFLNPDTFVAEHTLQDCLTYAQQHSDLGVMGVEMLQNDGQFALESRRGIPAPFTAFCKITGLTSLFPHSKTFGRYYMQYQDKGIPQRIEIVSGAFMLGRRDILMLMHGFDKDYFMYGEDIDLSYRLLLSGRHNYYYPTPIMHYKGESTEKSSLKYVHRFYEAMLIFFNKHFTHYRMGRSAVIKLAIYVRGVLAFVQQRIKGMRRYFDMNTLVRNDKYTFILAPKNLTAAQALCEKWALDVTYITTTEQSLAQKTNLQEEIAANHIVVYDTQVFSYAYILAAARTSSHHQRIGTYFAQHQWVVTHHRIMTLI